MPILFSASVDGTRFNPHSMLVVVGTALLELTERGEWLGPAPSAILLRACVAIQTTIVQLALSAREACYQALMHFRTHFVLRHEREGQQQLIFDQVDEIELA